MKQFLTICSIACFIAILKLPIEYYTFLRSIITLGAIALIYNFSKQRNYLLTVVFIIVLVLFNPIIPIYLHRKSAWIPLDVIVGILFLIISFFKKKELKKEEQHEEDPWRPKSHQYLCIPQSHFLAPIYFTPIF